MPAAKTIVSLNLKGGTGKTHIVWLLASVCQERNLRCLIVDLDQQGNITSSFLDKHTKPTGIERLLDPASDADAQTVVHRTKHAHIDIIPATPLLAPLDVSDQKTWEAADLHLSLVDPLTELAHEYDYILLDCPPRLSLASYAALCAGQHVIVPLEAADWGARGTQLVASAIRHVQKRHNPRLALLGYVVSRYKSRRSYQQEYQAQLRLHFGQDAFNTVLPDLADFEKAVTDRRLPTIYFPNSHASHAAHELFDEVESRIARGGPEGRPHVVRQRQPAAV